MTLDRHKKGYHSLASKKKAHNGCYGKYKTTPTDR